MRNIFIRDYNLLYIDCSDLIVNIFISISKLNLEFENLKEKDLKKLIFHFFIIELLKRSKSKTKRPVYFINKKFLLEFANKKYVTCFVSIIKHLKSLLPVPLILLENENIFKSDNGELKGLNERVSNRYINSKKTTYRLRKYLQVKEFYELITVLSDIKNIKQLST